MGGLAALAREAGHKVTGCDAGVYPPMSDQLRALGIELIEGFGADQLALQPDMFVVGNVVSRARLADGSPKFPLMEAILDAGLPYTSGPQWLAEHVLQGRHVLAVAGTHGKTTTTSLVASVMGEGGLDPTFVIGGKLNSAGVNARLGKGDYIVAEADESDASFLHLSVTIAVITNIDQDHMDTYDHDFNKLKEAFVAFTRSLPFYGAAIVCIDDANVREIVPKLSKTVITYGLSEDANVRAYDVQDAHGQMKFKVARTGFGEDLPDLDVTLNLPGLHNVRNALAAIAVGTEVDVDDAAICKALAEFNGVGRRFQRYGQVKVAEANGGGQFTLIDDYGHHPVEMAATLAAARGAFPNQRIVLAFQPHRYTRTRDCFEDFVKVLSGADGVILTEVYAASESPIVAADGRSLARALRVAGKVEPVFVEEISSVPQAIADFARNGDVVICMGAGSIGAVAGKTVELMGQA